MVKYKLRDPEEIFNELPLAIRSYFITTGVAPDMHEVQEDFEIIHKGINKLTRNNPNLAKKCFEYLELR